MLIPPISIQHQCLFSFSFTLFLSLFYNTEKQLSLFFFHYFDIFIYLISFTVYWLFLSLNRALLILLEFWYHTSEYIWIFRWPYIWINVYLALPHMMATGLNLSEKGKEEGEERKRRKDLSVFYFCLFIECASEWSTFAVGFPRRSLAGYSP